MNRRELGATVFLDPPLGFPKVVGADGNTEINNGTFYLVADEENGGVFMAYLNSETPRCDLEPYDQVIVTIEDLVIHQEGQTVVYENMSTKVWSEERCPNCIFNPIFAKSATQCSVAKKTTK